MTETVCSKLNPSADVFVPSKNSNVKDATIYECEVEDSSSLFSLISKTKMKEIAKQLVKDYLKNNGKKSITKQEIIKIFEMVVLACSSKTNRKISLSKLTDIGKLKEYSSVKSYIFDLSSFKPPKPSIFLSSLYGLYRHEQAVRPLLSLTLPPSNLKDNLWSVTSKDLSLWNPHCYEPCACPPMFGYCIPHDFFGNPFNLNSNCSNKGLHFCRYPPSPNGNESILFYTKPDYPTDVDLLESCIDEVKEEYSLEFYSEQLKSIVSGVCDLICNETVKESILIDGINDDHKEMFWDDDPSKFMYSDEILEDNCHRLLEMDYNEAKEGVAPEVEEMIRRCLSQPTEANCCDPPCSMWCPGRYERSDSVSTNISLLTDTTDFLLNEGGGSKRIFRRSFSANDCDLLLEEASLRKSYFEQAPMWSLFNGEDSLWKPLPECAQQDQHSKFIPKRVRDLRRQRSLT